MGNLRTVFKRFKLWFGRNNAESNFKACTYEQCLVCHVADCYTGKVAREQGEAIMHDFLSSLDDREEISCIVRT